MTIRSASVLVSGLMVLAVFDGPAAGQAMVEYGAAAGAAATAAGGMKGVSNSVNGVFGNLDKVMKAEHPGADTPTPATTVYTPSTPSRPTLRPTRRTARSSSNGKFAADPAPPPPPPDYEDPQQIQAGMGYQELVRRFGPPALQITDGASGATFTYLSKTGPVQVEFADGKVTSAQKTKS